MFSLNRPFRQKGWAGLAVSLIGIVVLLVLAALLASATGLSKSVADLIVAFGALALWIALMVAARRRQ